MIQVFTPTPQERNHTEMVEKLNKYIWNILKANGIRDSEMDYRVKLENGEKPFIRHIFLDGLYYITVTPSVYYNPSAHFLSSESGFYHYYNNAVASKQKK